MESLDKFSEFVIFRIGDFAFTAGKVITVALTLLITILVVWLIKLLMIRKRSPSKFDRGNIYALFQIIKYVIWIISILLILETLGLKLNALLAGSAALLVGIGLGLQNTFINFIAGIILLFEGSIKWSDILEVDDAGSKNSEDWPENFQSHKPGRYRNHFAKFTDDLQQGDQLESPGKENPVPDQGRRCLRK